MPSGLGGLCVEAGPRDIGEGLGELVALGLGSSARASRGFGLRGLVPGGPLGGLSGTDGEVMWLLGDGRG